MTEEETIEKNGFFIGCFLFTYTDALSIFNASCTASLLEFIEKVNKHMDKVDPIDAAYLDFQKAFEKLPHQKFLGKLSS